MLHFTGLQNVRIASKESRKYILTSTEVLVHFDPKVLLDPACDASTIGIGTVLYHRYEDCMERSTAYASKTLTKSENYIQIEREALSLVYGVKKFHQYIFSYRFTLLTDHKPCIADNIWSESRNISVMAASRLQRWAIILSTYMIYSISQKRTWECRHPFLIPRVTNDDCFEKEQS